MLKPSGSGASGWAEWYSPTLHISLFDDSKKEMIDEYNLTGDSLRMMPRWSRGWV